MTKLLNSFFLWGFLKRIIGNFFELKGVFAKNERGYIEFNSISAYTPIHFCEHSLQDFILLTFSCTIVHSSSCTTWHSCKVHFSTNTITG